MGNKRGRRQIAPLFSDKFVNTESGQTVGDTALAETVRLVYNTEMVNGVPIGYFTPRTRSSSPTARRPARSPPKVRPPSQSWPRT